MGFFYLGGVMSSTPGALNVFSIQLISHFLQPFGLHFVINALTSYSAMGGTFDLLKPAVVEINNHYY
jgi:phosphotransferase system  glucose/maltose/N-acetylglucosamine-specific IIC component